MKDFIFDLDGPLLDSISVGINSLIKAAQVAGVKRPTFRMIQALWGHNFEHSLIPILAEELNWPLKKDREVIEHFYQISCAQKYPVQPGLSDDLKRLSTICKLGIATNRDRASLEYRLKEQGIDINIFTHIHTPELGVCKPDPAVFNYFWNGAGFKPENTIFIGDSIEHDLAAAKNHQPSIKFVAILSGLHSTAEFVRSGVKLSCIFKNVRDVFQAKYLLS